jgi:hypothetical protein
LLSELVHWNYATTTLFNIALKPYSRDDVDDFCFGCKLNDFCPAIHEYQYPNIDIIGCIIRRE